MRAFPRILACALCIMLLACSGCVTTPATVAVVSKADDTYETRIAEAETRDHAADAGVAGPVNSAETLGIPDTWQDTLEFANFRVTIDAGVEYPDGAACPVYEAESVSFSRKSDSILSLMQVMIPAPTGWRAGSDTYESVLQQITALMLGQYDSDTNTYSPFTGEEATENERELERLNALLQTLPHENEYDSFQGFLTDSGSVNSYLDENGRGFVVSITDDTLLISRYGDYVYPEDRFINDPVTDGSPRPTPYPNITITEEDAIRAAGELLGTMEESFTIASVERAAILKDYCNRMEEDQTETQGYYIRCVRSVGQVSTIDSEEMGSERIHFDDTDYSAPLSAECLELFVDGDGICMLRWTNPISIRTLVTADVELLPFDQVSAIILQMLTNGLSWSEDAPSRGGLNATRQGIVRQVSFRYAYVRQKDNLDVCYLTPVWVVEYLTEDTLDAIRQGYQMAPYLICINAVDGTRVSLSA